MVDDRSRQELYSRLEAFLGPEVTTMLIEHLPPVGWADMATKHDLAGLEQRMEFRMKASASGCDASIRSSSTPV